MHTLVVATSLEQTTGVLINNLDFTVHDYVVAILAEQLLGANRVVQEGNQRGVCSLIKVCNAEVVLDLVDSCLKHTYGALFLIDFVVDIGL